MITYTQLKSCYYAVIAGTFASLSAILTKITFDDTSRFLLVSLCLSGCILCNIIMWWAHTNAMCLSESSLKVILINTSVNFCLTGVLGRLLFGELKTKLWWFGICLIFCGLCIIFTSGSSMCAHAKLK